MDRLPSVLSKLTHICLCLLTDEHMRETILEDMEERYIWDRKNKGPFRAGLSWLSALLVILATFILKSILWRCVMFKNYLRTALRNIKRQPGFSFINISGFAIGLACVIMILLWVQNEWSYDRFHAHSDNIYRLCNPEHPYHAPQAAGILKENIPEIKDFARIRPGSECIVEYKEKKFIEKNIAHADAAFLKIFSFKFKLGDPESTLKEPFSLVISDKIAHKYFGNKDPLGKQLTINNSGHYTVTGVMEDMPQNSHFRFDAIATLSNADEVFGKDWMNNWGWENFLIYFEMQENFFPGEVAEKCNQLILEHRPSEAGDPPPDYSLQNLKDIHLFSSRFENDIQPQNSITYVLIFSAIGLLILLIACFNYVNLLTASAASRAKEIGIRKVVGAERSNLVFQFIGESYVILSAALVISLVLVKVMLPIFNSLSNKSLELSALFRMSTLLPILGIMIITAILSGSYPAFILSGIQPRKAMTASGHIRNSGFNARKICVGIQFTIVIILFCSGFLMFRQIHFLQRKEMGFDKNYTLVSEVNSFESEENYSSLKQEMLKESVVKSVTAASRVPSDPLNNWGGILVEGQSQKITLPFVHVHHDYFETLGITASQGRLFSKDIETDLQDAVILNTSAVKALGIQDDPIGQTVEITWPSSNRKVIGVIDDFHFESLYETMKPTVFVPDFRWCRKLLVNLYPSNVQHTMDRLYGVCSRLYEDQIFEFHFLDEKLDSLYRSDRNTFRLLGYFTGLAVLIACMGLFGMATLMMRSRTKEIGIRKVLGAHITGIIILFSKDFSRWILLANLIAWPIAYYAMYRWLQNFAYRIDITIWPFLLAGLVSLVIALLTVSWQAVKVATTNPAESLRYE